VNGQNGGTLNHIAIRGCFVHDVTGEVNWISGDTSGNAPGVTFKAGWDASKHTGGIVFDVQAGSGATVTTRFNDILVENNTVQNCSFGGIVIKQLDDTVHWGTRSSASDASWLPHTNVTIRGNYLEQKGSSLACDGVYLTEVQGGLVEQNVVDRQDGRLFWPCLPLVGRVQAAERLTRHQHRGHHLEQRRGRLLGVAPGRGDGYRRVPGPVRHSEGRPGWPRPIALDP